MHKSSPMSNTRGKGGFLIRIWTGITSSDHVWYENTAQIGCSYTHRQVNIQTWLQYLPPPPPPPPPSDVNISECRTESLKMLYWDCFESCYACYSIQRNIKTYGFVSSNKVFVWASKYCTDTSSRKSWADLFIRVYIEITLLSTLASGKFCSCLVPWYHCDIDTRNLLQWL